MKISSSLTPCLSSSLNGFQCVDHSSSRPQVYVRGTKILEFKVKTSPCN